jgi:antitoxin ParD1/3/4
MNVNLTEHLEGLIKKKVATGLYNNASEVVREALRLMEWRDPQEMARYEAAKGFEQLQEGKSAPLDMRKAKKSAINNARKGHVVNPLVKP